MKVYRLLLLLSVCLLLASCRCKQQAVTIPEPVVLYATDSVHTEYIETLRIDTITIEIPIPTESVTQIVRDITSYLSTSVAESTAWINPDGTLGHILKNREGTLQGQAVTASKDTEKREVKKVYEEVPVYVDRAVEVERQLTRWQKIKIETGGLAIGALALVVLGILIYIIRRCRK